jgi:hypothetical protein
MTLMVMLMGAIIAGGHESRPATMAGPISNLDKTGTTAELGHDGLAQGQALYQLADGRSLERNSPGLARVRLRTTRVVTHQSCVATLVYFTSDPGKPGAICHRVRVLPLGTFRSNGACPFTTGS